MVKMRELERHLEANMRKASINSIESGIIMAIDDSVANSANNRFEVVSVRSSEEGESLKIGGSGVIVLDKLDLHAGIGETDTDPANESALSRKRGVSMITRKISHSRLARGLSVRSNRSNASDNSTVSVVGQRNIDRLGLPSSTPTIHQRKLSGASVASSNG